MTDPDLIGLFVEPLERLRIPYMITGAVASVVYGDPRFTRDIDLVLDLGEADVERIAEAFPDHDFYVPPIDVLRREAIRPRDGHFNILHHDTALRADIYVFGDDPLHAWGFERRKRISVDEGQIWLAPPEYVILRKLEYYRDSGSDRHFRDVVMMLRISGESLERDELDRWVRELGVTEAWSAVAASVEGEPGDE